MAESLVHDVRRTILYYHRSYELTVEKGVVADAADRYFGAIVADLARNHNVVGVGFEIVLQVEVGDYGTFLLGAGVVVEYGACFKIISLRRRTCRQRKQQCSGQCHFVGFHNRVYVLVIILQSCRSCPGRRVPRIRPWPNARLL